MTDELYAFGPFRLDSKERLLLRDGKPIQLKPKVFDLLLLLVTSVGHVLSKDELMKEIWADSFVEEHNLTVSISLLRVALGDNHRHPVYIQTVARRGYRFVAPVKQLSREEVVVHKWSSDVSADVSSERSGQINSLAVLPFRNISAHTRTQYLGLGLADALITRLSKLRQITVRPTSAVLRFAGKAPVSAGRHLKVETVLDGSIQKWSKQIRVTAQHVRVRDGVILWAGKFDEEFTNFFAVEDSISEQVANVLSTGLNDGQRGQLKRRYTDNSNAYDAYLKGRYFLTKRSADNLDKCIKYFNLAVELDPNFALAFAGLATAHGVLGGLILAPPKEAFRKAKAAALQALKLDNEIAEAHTVIGHIKMVCDWDWTGAEKALRLAIALDPNSANAHQIYSLYLRTIGRLEEAMIEIERARELDPISLSINTSMGALLYLSRQYDKAIEQVKNAIEMDGNFPTAYLVLGCSYEQKGLEEQAIAEFRKIPELLGNNTESTACLAHALAKSGRTAEAQDLLLKFEQEAKVKHVSQYLVAVIHTALGNTDEAFVCLEKALEEQDEELALIKMDPRFDNLRNDSRFVTLLERMGLTP